MDEAAKDQPQVRSVKPEFAEFLADEWGEWQEWTAGAVDGRLLRKRDKRAIDVNGVKVHALKAQDGRIWDCINGWRTVATQQLGVSAVGSSDEAKAYAQRVWDGQSVSLPEHERMRRVKAALEAQGMSMEGVTL